MYMLVEVVLLVFGSRHGYDSFCSKITLVVGLLGLCCCLLVRRQGGSLLNTLVLDVLVDEQQELLKVDLLVVVEVKLLHVIVNGLGVDLLAQELEQGAQLGGADGAVRVLVKDVEALLVAVELLLCESCSGLLEVQHGLCCCVRTGVRFGMENEAHVSCCEWTFGPHTEKTWTPFLPR